MGSGHGDDNEKYLEGIRPAPSMDREVSKQGSKHPRGQDTHVGIVRFDPAGTVRKIDQKQDRNRDAKDGQGAQVD